MDQGILDHFRMKILQTPRRILKESGKIEEIYDQPERSKREDSQMLIIDGVSKELRRREDDCIVELGTSSGIRFMTSEGIKKMDAGKRYDEALNEM